MSERKTTEQMEQEYQFMLSKVSHEVRNPVTLINSYLQFIEKAHPEVEDFEYWEDIQDQMDFLKGLLDDLSLYHNSWQLHRKAVLVSSHLEKITQELTPAYRYLGIHLIYENLISSPEPLLSLDVKKFKQAMFNLIRNAGEAIDGDGIIRIISQKENDAIQILIQDNGCGIDPNYLPTLFDPFITHKESGTGLGLAIVKQIVQAHGGTIEILSYPNEGTTFTISLPCT